VPELVTKADLNAALERFVLRMTLRFTLFFVLGGAVFAVVIKS
jgi:hypothetical protein